MNCESIIYLDADFLSKKYEDCFGETVMTSLVRDEGFTAGIKALFASGGAHTKEIKTYSCSVYGMLKNLNDELNKYETFSSIDSNVHNKIGWMEGRFFIGLMSITKNTASAAGIKGNILEEGKAFEIDTQKGMVTLVTKDQYFASGYENLLNTMSPIHLSFEAQVRCLLKVVGWNKVINMAVGVPYVILDRS